MEPFGMAALFGLILGFMFGVGCAAAVMYTIYMGGYKQAVEDSLKPQPTVRLQKVLHTVHAKLDRSQQPS